MSTHFITLYSLAINLSFRFDCLWPPPPLDLPLSARLVPIAPVWQSFPLSLSLLFYLFAIKSLSLQSFGRNLSRPSTYTRIHVKHSGHVVCMNIFASWVNCVIRLSLTIHFTLAFSHQTSFPHTFRSRNNVNCDLFLFLVGHYRDNSDWTSVRLGSPSIRILLCSPNRPIHSFIRCSSFSFCWLVCGWVDGL